MVVNINDLDWQVFFAHSRADKLKLDGTDCMGITYYQEQEIYLNKDLGTDLFRQTVIHELSHAFLFSFGYHLDCEMVEEAVCDFLGSHLDKIYKLTNKVIAVYHKERG